MTPCQRSLSAVLPSGSSSGSPLLAQTNSRDRNKLLKGSCCSGLMGNTQNLITKQKIWVVPGGGAAGFQREGWQPLAPAWREGRGEHACWAMLLEIVNMRDYNCLASSPEPSAATSTPRGRSLSMLSCCWWSQAMTTRWGCSCGFYRDILLEANKNRVQISMRCFETHRRQIVPHIGGRQAQKSGGVSTFPDAPRSADQSRASIPRDKFYDTSFCKPFCPSAAFCSAWRTFTSVGTGSPTSHWACKVG